MKAWLVEAAMVDAAVVEAGWWGWGCSRHQGQTAPKDVFTDAGGGDGGGGEGCDGDGGGEGGVCRVLRLLHKPIGALFHLLTNCNATKAEEGIGTVYYIARSAC